LFLLNQFIIQNRETVENTIDSDFSKDDSHQIISRQYWHPVHTIRSNEKQIQDCSKTKTPFCFCRKIVLQNL
jgi:hypothetical protein